MNKRLADQHDLSALSELAPELARTFVSVASDIALVLDANGVIRDVALGGREPVTASANAWVGRPWADTVTSDTRLKIEQLLQEVSTNGVSRRREVNHPSPTGLDIPVAYAAIRLGEGGPVLAVGRDLRAVAAIQQRFVESQEELERDYWKRRQAESRYRTLFQVATDAVLVVDAATLRVVEANQAAAQLFDLSIEQLVGKNATIGIDRSSRPAVEELLTTARASGRPVEMRARLVGKRGTTSIAATPFRAEDTMLLLVRASAVQAAGDPFDSTQSLASLVEHMRDGVVVTDSGGRILLVNRAFLGFVQLSDESAAKGHLLSNWLGGDEGPLKSILTHARKHGMTARTVASMVSARGEISSVEVAAMLLPEGDQECIGFTFAHAEARRSSPRVGGEAMSAAMDHLTAQLGIVALPGLIDGAAAAAERHFIVAALERVHGDRSRAAGLLHLSFDSLEQRMRELGLTDNDRGSDASPRPGAD